MKSRAKLLPAFIGVVVFGFALYAVMMSLQTVLINATGIIDYKTWVAKAVDQPFYRFLWLIGDMTEAPFYKSILGGIGLLLGAVVAYFLSYTNSKLQGFSITYGTGLFPWVLLASLIGLAISVCLFGHNLADGWLPTFVPFVSVPATVVLLYGGGWKNTLMAGVLGSLFTFPISALIIQKILTPWGLPGLSGSVLGMCLGAIIVFEICRAVPWMKLPEAKEPEEPEEIENAEKLKEPQAAAAEAAAAAADPLNNAWFFRRVLADFTEANFFANELASAGLILGTILSWVLNPHHPAYGSLYLPAILLSQFLTGSLAVFLYADKYREYGWYPTFLPVVSVAPAVVLLFGGTMSSVLTVSVLGAIATPPLAHLVIRNVPKHWHLFVGNTLAMGVCTAVIAAMMQYLGF